MVTSVPQGISLAPSSLTPFVLSISVCTRIVPPDFLVSSAWPHQMHILEDSVLYLCVILLMSSVEEDLLYDPTQT